MVMSYLLFFTYKECPEGFHPGIDTFDSDIYECVEGRDYINASNKKIIDDAKKFSNAYQRDGSPIIIFDELSFEDNLVKIIRPYHNLCKDLYVCYRSTLDHVEDSIIFQEADDPEDSDRVYPLQYLVTVLNSKMHAEENDIIIKELFFLTTYPL